MQNEDTNSLPQAGAVVKGPSQQPTGSFYAVIPLSILHDPDLRPNAKLLYAEISGLTCEAGYCWASNEYLGSKLDISGKTASALITQLAQKGYIMVNVIRDERNAITERQIKLAAAVSLDTLCPKMSIPMLENEHTPMLKNEHTPMLKNGKEKNIKNNIYIPPKAPQGGQACDNVVSADVAEGQKPRRARNSREPMKQTVHLPERFTSFWKYYCSVVPTDRNPGNKQAAMRAWDKLSPDAALVARMGRALIAQSQTDDWQRGIGVPHASTWLNGRRWEDPIHGGGAAGPAREPEPEEGSCVAWV